MCPVAQLVYSFRASARRTPVCTYARNTCSKEGSIGHRCTIGVHLLCKLHDVMMPALISTASHLPQFCKYIRITKRTAPGVPRWSPTLVLPWLEAAYLRSSRWDPGLTALYGRAIGFPPASASASICRIAFGALGDGQGRETARPACLPSLAALLPRDAVWLPITVRGRISFVLAFIHTSSLFYLWEVILFSIHILFIFFIP